MQDGSGGKRGRALGLLLVAAIGAGFLFLRSDFGQALFGGWSFVRSVSEDHGTYYRLKVKLAYKGEPQDFDIVVGCNVRVTTYKDSSTTYEAGMTPTVFGRRMSDGKGLVVRPPLACRGETTTNGGAPSDLLPLVVVYDDADTLDFGIAYLSEDAYESSLSVLKFGGATIEKATHSEFDEFRRAQPNLVHRESYWSAIAGDQVLQRMGLARVDKHLATECQGYERLLVPEEVRSVVHEQWPTAHPRYWMPDDYHVENALIEAILPNVLSRRLLQSDRSADRNREAHTLLGLIHDDAIDPGLSTRAGGGRLGSIPDNDPYRRFYPGAYYPAARNDYLKNVWPTDPTARTNYAEAHKTLSDMDVDFRDGLTRGFAYCSVSIGLLHPADDDLMKIVDGKRSLARIDGLDVPWTVKPVANPSIERPVWIFERDDHVFRLLYFGLGTYHGDV